MMRKQKTRFQYFLSWIREDYKFLFCMCALIVMELSLLAIYFKHLR